MLMVFIAAYANIFTITSVCKYAVTNVATIMAIVFVNFFPID